MLAVTFDLCRSPVSGPLRYGELARALGVSDGQGAPLADGREEEARRLYHRMATNSFEARTYLARQAFAARD